MSAMTNNIIGHSKRLRNDLINLVSKIRNSFANVNGMKRRINCIKEFHNNFNSHNDNNVHNSITLHILSIVLIDSTIDSYEHVHPVAIRHKYEENMLIKTHCNNVLN